LFLVLVVVLLLLPFVSQKRASRVEKDND